MRGLISPLAGKHGHVAGEFVQMTGIGDGAVLYSACGRVVELASNSSIACRNCWRDFLPFSPIGFPDSRAARSRPAIVSTARKLT